MINVAGHLREQNGTYQMVLSWKDETGKRRTKSISTGLPVKGNKKRAESLLRQTQKEFNPETMQQVGDLYMRFPEEWVVAQEVMFADSTTFMAFNNNMRNLVMDKLVGAQMVVFNRLTPGADTMPLHKIARAANRRIDILYDFTDGSTHFDDVEDPLPFDINSDVICIHDEDYALWYRDVTEEPKKYDGKTVCFKGQVAMLRRQKEGMFAPGRFVMTCCVEDIEFCGIPCRYAEAKSLESRGWVMVTAKVSAEKHPLYKGEIGPVLTALQVETNVQPAEPDVCTF